MSDTRMDGTETSGNPKEEAGSATFRRRLLAGETLVGTFVKTPAHDLVEVLMLSGLDFLCLDAEHAAFDRARLDACLAVAVAHGFQVLVRVGSPEVQALQQVLDAGASGVVVPHVDSVEKASRIARRARFGHGGRGYAGSTRWAGFTTRTMPELLARSAAETVVIAQIEEPAGVEASEAIAAVDGIDALFAGPADLAVCYGADALDAPPVREAMRRSGEAARRQGKAFVTFAPDTRSLEALRALGVSVFVIGSEHGFVLGGARALVTSVHGERHDRD